MAPKKQKQSLADFLHDEKTGKVDWADDFDDFPPPMQKEDRGAQRRGTDWLSSMPDRAERDRSTGPPAGSFGPGGGGSSMMDRAAYPPREELPLPTAPPYTAFIGNLSFEVTEGEIMDFLAPNKTTSVRLLSGPDGRPKGFGYVEFETLDGLKDSLTRSGAMVAGRAIRVSVAEPRDAKGGSGSGFGSSAAEEASQWRRAGPLPPSEGMTRRTSDRPGFNRFEGAAGGASGFDNMEVGPGGRAGFGSRFAPSAPPPREQRRQDSLVEPGTSDVASDWRTGKPVSELASPRRSSAAPSGPDGARRSNQGSYAGGDATDIDEKYANQERLGFGSKFQPTPPESPSLQKRSGMGMERRSTAGLASPGPGDSADTWRTASSRKPSSQTPPLGSPNGEPAQRKKLELKPRSTPLASSTGAAAAPETPTSATSSKVNNPFGGARPVDASEREREIEEKMQQREKERKEEEQKRREKQKAERAAAGEKAVAEGVPTGPKADRAKGGRGSEKGTPRSARSSPAPAHTNGNASVSTVVAAETDAAAAAAVSTTTESNTVKQAPPPTGAWGGGRKPSGALASGGAAPLSKTENGSADQGSAAVDQITRDVESTTLNA